MASNRPLSGDLTVTGMDQASLYAWLANATDLINEIKADHATFKTAVDNIETLVEELHDDHATFKTAADQVETLIEELHDDHATFKTVVDAEKTLLNQARTHILYGVFGNPTFAIDTNFDVKSTEIVYYANGGTLKTLADNTNFDTGTAKTITGAKWGAAMLTVNSSGTGVVTWAAAAAYDSEALAIAALAAPAATDTVMGYVTVLAHASGFTAGTDALQGGTGGNVATTTNYYNEINPNTLMIGAAVSSSAPATLTAPKPASAPATLTAAKPAAAPASLANSTDLTLLRT